MIKQNDMSLFNKENEKLNEKIMNDNKKYLDIFDMYLEKQGYKDDAISQHLSQVDFYINDYLMWGLPRPMQEGCSLDIVGFIENKVNEKVIPVNVFNIDKFLNSILLFYKCMLENGYVSKEAYEDCVNDAKEYKDKMIEDYYDKNPEPIDIDKIIELIEMANGFGKAYINVKTGQSEIVPDDEAFYIGDINKLYDKLDGINWVQIPEFRDYDVMNKFVLSLKNNKQQDELYQILHHKKAYRNFKDAIDRMGIANAYYELYDDEIIKIAMLWMKENIEDDVNDFDY